MKGALLRWLVASLGLLPALALAQAPDHAVRPGQLFAGHSLSVHAPDSEGWMLAVAASNGISFARRGAEPNESFGAQAILIDLPPSEGRDGFVEVVRKHVMATNPPPRFTALEASYEYSDRRGYPCVRFKGSFDDQAARTIAGTLATMRLQVVALYCRHPSAPGVGFFAAYSRRGGSAAQDIEGPAQRFIDGVQVSPPGKGQ